MARGSLRSLLDDTSVELSVELRIKMALDASEGMQFLHSHNPPLVHRDLKSQNLLVSEGWTCKVADFGTARICHVCSTGPANGSLAMSSFTGDRTMTRGVGTLLWSAPEVLRGDTDYSIDADCYSFGIVLWELWTRSLPFEALSTSWAVCNAVQAGERPSLEMTNADTFPAAYMQLMQICWVDEPANRPSFKHSCTVLKSLDPLS